MSIGEKHSLEVSSEYGPFYNNGKISVTKEHLICVYKSQVNFVCKDTGKTLRTIPLNDLSVTCSQLSPNGQKLVIADAILHLRLFDLSAKETVCHSWRSLHSNHIRCMKFNEAGNLLATGGTDSAVKVWDIDHRYCTHNFKRNAGVIWSLLFFPYEEEEVRLFSGADNGEICLYDLRKKSVVAKSNHHSSSITDMIVTEDHKIMISSGRDNIVTLWDTKTLTVQKTIPVYESIESLLLVTKHFPEDKGPCFITAGAKGVLKVWDSSKGTAIVTETDGRHKAGILQVCGSGGSDEDGSIVVVGNDYFISLHDVTTLGCSKQFCGFFDDVLEVKYFGFAEEFLAVANNSDNITVYTVSGWNCQILRGHTDIVVGLDVCPTKRHLMVSCSKDNSIRIWQANKEGLVDCVAVGFSHTMSVEAVAFFRSSTTKLLSASADCMLKMWQIPSTFTDKEPVVLKTKLMKNAHSKSISCLAVSPNDNLIATGSEDHTAKLWNASSLEVEGVLKGHKHGLTSVQFSPVDKCVLTASRDRTVRVWRISDCSTAMVLEHEMPVMKLLVLNQGRQVISGCSDGFLNIWNLLTQTLKSHIEAHSQHAWAIDVSLDNKSIVSGGSDSLIRFWQDVSERDKMEEQIQQDEYICKEQLLSNALRAGKRRWALCLALDLDKPQNVYNILKELQETGNKDKLLDLLDDLSDTRKKTLVNYMIKWNTHSVYSEVGQSVLQVLLDTSLPTDYLMNRQQYRDLQAYTERHYKRRQLLNEKVQFIPYLVKQMTPADYHHQGILGEDSTS